MRGKEKASKLEKPVAAASFWDFQGSSRSMIDALASHATLTSGARFDQHIVLPQK